jgi:hypothetical protein
VSSTTKTIIAVWTVAVDRKEKEIRRKNKQQQQQHTSYSFFFFFFHYCWFHVIVPLFVTRPKIGFLSFLSFSSNYKFLFKAREKKNR